MDVIATISAAGLQKLRQRPYVVDVSITLTLLVGILLTAYFFSREVLEAAWQNEGILFVAFSLLADLLGGVVRAQLTVLGVVLGTSLVWAFDTYKKWQTFAPLTLVFAAVWTFGIFNGGIAGWLSIGHGSLFVVSVVVGAHAGGLPLVQWAIGRSKRLRGVPPVSFRRAPSILFLVVVGVVVVGLIDTHVLLASGTPELAAANDIPLNAATGFLLTAFFHRFTQYDNDVRIVQIGPARSGKTSMIGGLAGDIDREAHESDGGGAIDEIRFRLEDERRFPDPTRGGDYYEFSYMSNRPVFRKQNTISTLDYSGERLTGGNDDNAEPLSDRIVNYRQRRDNSISHRLLSWLSQLVPLVDHRDDWAAGIEALENGENEMRALAKLADHADIVAFTIPLDDFLGKPIQRDNIPSYLDDVRLIEPTGNDQFLVEFPDGSKKTVVRRDRELQYEETGEPYEFPWGDLKTLPQTPDGRYYDISRSRSHRDEYRDEYQELIRTLNDDRSKTFVWTTTMADLVEEDFDAVYERARAIASNPEGQSKNLKEDINRANQAGVFERNATEFRRHDRLGRKIHARWIQQEYIKTAWPGFDKMLADTFEEFVYPVWFEIDPDRRYEEAPGIRTENDTILKGSDLVLERFESHKLLERAPLLGDGKSPTEAGYRVLYAASLDTLNDSDAADHGE